MSNEEARTIDFGKKVSDTFKTTSPIDFAYLLKVKKAVTGK